MAKTPASIPVTDLRQDAAAALKRMRDSGQPIVITQRGRAAAVVVSVEVYEAAEHERPLLRLLAKGTARLRQARASTSTRCLPTPTNCSSKSIWCAFGYSVRSRAVSGGRHLHPR
jgi:prevent-host-death family protein